MIIREEFFMNLLKNIWVRGIIIICILIGGFFFLQSYNQVEKPTLVNTQGRAFEKATVVEVLKDNIQKLLAIFKNNIIKKIIINDGHLLNLKTIELLDNLYQMKSVDIILFSTFKSTNNNILFKERFL